MSRVVLAVLIVGVWLFSLVLRKQVPRRGRLLLLLFLALVSAVRLAGLIENGGALGATVLHAVLVIIFALGALRMLRSSPLSTR